MNADGTQKMTGGGVWAVVHANSEGHGASRERAKRGGDANGAGGGRGNAQTHGSKLRSAHSCASSIMDELGIEGGAQQGRCEGSEGRE